MLGQIFCVSNCNLDLSMVRYPRMIDVLETEFKKERNETYETNQLLSRKQFINESLEQFHSVLSGLAARCNFGVLEDCILKDVFIVNMNNREAQNELCRSLKTPEEVYRIALSYERGNKYATSYVATGSLGTQDHLQAVGFRLNQNQLERSVENTAIIANEAENHIKGEAQTEVKIGFKTTDATTATNQTLRENIWIDVRKRSYV